MSNEDNASAADALREWFLTADEAADVLPSARLSLMHRILTNIGPHGQPDQWAEFLREPRKREPHLFRDEPYFDEVRIKKLKTMTAKERLHEVNKRGGNQ